MTTNHKVQIALIAAGLATLALGRGLTLGADKPTSAPTSAPAGVSIPLSSIYATFKQEGLKTTGIDRPAVGLDYKSPSVVGFAWAKDFEALELAPVIAPAGDAEAPVAIGRPEKKGSTLWAIVFFVGEGTVPPPLAIDSVTRKDGSFELAYHHVQDTSNLQTKLLRFPYMAWIPLGDLPAGSYSLTLIESGTKKVRTSWTVTGKGGAAPSAAAAPCGTGSIPLKSIYYTAKQEGVGKADIQDVPDLKGRKEPSVLGLVWAKDYKGAANGTLLSPAGDGKTPLAVQRPREKGQTLWAVVFFANAGSIPPQYLIDSVTVKDGTFTLAYHSAGSGGSTLNVFPYVAWVPLGDLPAGKYKLAVVGAEPENPFGGIMLPADKDMPPSDKDKVAKLNAGNQAAELSFIVAGEGGIAPGDTPTSAPAPDAACRPEYVFFGVVTKVGEMDEKTKAALSRRGMVSPDEKRCIVVVVMALENAEKYGGKPPVTPKQEVTVVVKNPADFTSATILEFHVTPGIATTFDEVSHRVPEPKVLPAAPVASGMVSDKKLAPEK